MSNKPKIYVFSAAGGGDGVCYAMAEDGSSLGSHWCSNEGFARHDLGVLEGSRPDRHETYMAHYPGGYEMEFIRASDLKTHEGFNRAYALNLRGETNADPDENRKE
jgi:hypothetical protein